MMMTHSFSVTFSPLSHLHPGEQGTFYKFRGSPTLLTDLHSMGLTLGSTLTLEQQDPEIIIGVQGQLFTLSRPLADLITVRVEPVCPLIPPSEFRELGFWQRLWAWVYP